MLRRDHFFSPPRFFFPQACFGRGCFTPGVFRVFCWDTSLGRGIKPHTQRVVAPFSELRCCRHAVASTSSEGATTRHVTRPGDSSSPIVEFTTHKPRVNSSTLPQYFQHGFGLKCLCVSGSLNFHRWRAFPLVRQSSKSLWKLPRLL